MADQKFFTNDTFDLDLNLDRSGGNPLKRDRVNQGNHRVLCGQVRNKLIGDQGRGSHNLFARMANGLTRIIR